MAINLGSPTSTVVANLGSPTSNSVPLTGNGYQYSPNGNGGVNFYYNGQPVTQEQYGGGTHQDAAAVQNILDTVHTDYVNSQNAASTNNTNGGGGSSGYSLVDPNAAATAQASINGDNAGISAADTTLVNSLANNTSDYNGAKTRQTGANAQADAGYNMTKSQNISAENTAQSQIATQTRNQTNALQRLLGLAGSGNSSASEIAAPYYVGRMGADANNANQTAFGNGQDALELSYNGPNGAKKQGEDALTSIDSAYNSNNQSARGAHASAIAGLLHQLIVDTGNFGTYSGRSGAATAAAQTPYQQRYNQALSDGAGYVAHAPVAYAAPTPWTAPGPTAFVQGLNKPAATTAAPVANNAPANVTVAPDPNLKQQPLLAGAAA